MSIYTLSQVLELVKSHGSEFSNGAWVLLSLSNIHTPYLSNSDKVAEFENLLFFAQRCIGAGCEPRVRPLPGQDGQGVSLAAPAEADQVEGTPTSYQQLDARIRQMRRDHHGCTSRGLDVELARYFYEFPVPGDFLPALLLDLQQCAAACISAGCEPRVRPLPGQSAGVARLAAATHADQVEGTPARKQAQGTCFFPRPLGKSWLVSVEFLTGARAGEIFEIRWYKRSDALLCKRNFKSPPGLKLSRVTIRECLGYSTWDGWVDVPFGQEAIA